MNSSKNCMSSSSVKSKIVMGPLARSLLRSIATPRKFVFRTSAVRTDVPANTSKKRMFSNSNFRCGFSVTSLVKLWPAGSRFVAPGGVKKFASSSSLWRVFAAVCETWFSSSSCWVSSQWGFLPRSCFAVLVRVTCFPAVGTNMCPLSALRWMPCSFQRTTIV